MRVHRRHFLKSAASMAVAAPAFGTIASCAGASGPDVAAAAPEVASSPLALQPDPNGWLDLPEGFSYVRFSNTGEEMSDGFLVPAMHDGMEAFPVEGDPDRCLLVRNHELNPSRISEGPFGERLERVDQLDKDQAYDLNLEDAPLAAGTTTLLYNVKTGQLEESWLSLIGTDRNCAGGPTPWGSWLSCEESRANAGDATKKDHGYTFEVPTDRKGLVEPIPLTAMGRFNHEAAAVDPSTGIVYQTEDSGDGLFYRFLPDTPGELVKGGRLQALVLADQPQGDTRNWEETTIASGQSLPVRWVDLVDVTAPDGDLAQRGYAAGAALFARGEGMAFALEDMKAAIYFACTNGGQAKYGQIWRYQPSEFEGTAREAEAPGMLTLHYESPDQTTMDMCDNIVAAPWGHLVICEDGSDDEFLHGLTPDGRTYHIARNAHPGQSEVAGACFSPDGSTLFMNIQTPGATFAITGPWETLYS